jgi:hypothetical protein
LLVETGNPLGSVGVFNSTNQTSRETHDRIVGRFASPPRSTTLAESDTFNNQVGLGEIQSFVASL